MTKFALYRLGLGAIATSAIALGLLGASSTAQTPRHRDLTGSTSGAELYVENDTTSSFNGFGVEGVVTNSAGGIGVLGYGNNTSVGNYGVYGSVLGPNGTGVYGYAQKTVASSSATPDPSTESVGLLGLSLNGPGVEGQTSFPNGSDGTQVAGVIGLDTSNAANLNDGVLGVTPQGAFGVRGIGGNNALGGVEGTATSGVGVYGFSPNYVGVYGNSTSYYGMIGQSSSSYGVYAQSNTSTGLYATTGGSFGSEISSTSSSGFGVFAHAPLVGIFGGSSSTQYGLVGRSSTYPLLLEDNNGNTIFFVDNAGGVHYKATGGGLSSFAQTRHGYTATTYTNRTTQEQTEDVGSARLVNGVAVVHLDPAYAESIDATTAYHVFLTPYGESHGLYIAQRTNDTFVVRENGAGRSTLDFDYRIVAKPYGTGERRMALVREAQGPLFPRGPQPIEKTTSPLKSFLSQKGQQAESHGLSKSLTQFARIAPARLVGR